MTPTSKASTAENTQGFMRNPSETSSYNTVSTTGTITRSSVDLSVTKATSQAPSGKATMNCTMVIRPTSVYTSDTSTPQGLSTNQTKSIPQEPMNTTTTPLTVSTTLSVTSITLVSSFANVSTMPPTVAIFTTDVTTTAVQEKELLLPLFYIIIIASVGATLCLVIITLLLYMLCLRGRQRRKKVRRRRRRDSERVSLCNLERTNSSGSSHSSISGHQMSIVNRTDVVIRHKSAKNYTDSLDRRSSKLGLWFSKGSLRPMSTHTPTLSCSTFKPNQQLYLPHVQVQVHVNNELTPGPFTAESRVGSYCKLDEETERNPLPPRPSSTNSENSLVEQMLATR